MSHRLPAAAGAAALVCVVVLAPPAARAAGLAATQAVNSGNTAWLLTSTALVLSMTLPGLVAFYSGLVRSKNVLSVAMQCFAIACLVSILWVAGGYGLAFGRGGALQALIGSPAAGWLGSIGRNALHGTTPVAAFAMFQLTFAIITPALVIGGFAERIKFSAVLWFSGLWLLLVYLPVCHWVWGGGWLARLGVLDFAGGIVVHVTAGVGALVSALVLRERKGFPDIAMPASVPDLSALPALKPNQPTHNNAAPTITIQGACGGCTDWGKPRRGPSIQAASNAETPAVRCTTMPPAKSITPRVAK